MSKWIAKWNGGYVDLSKMEAIHLVATCEDTTSEDYRVEVYACVGPRKFKLRTFRHLDEAAVFARNVVTL